MPDIDECTVGNGGCSDDCRNVAGSYTCSCPPGQELGVDTLTCQGKEWVIFVSDEYFYNVGITH